MEGEAANPAGGHELAASVVISSYNRADALVQTLAALGCQSIPAEQYEIIVVDDGSTDPKYLALNALSLRPCLRVLHHSENRGVSAGRNLGVRNARGCYLIFVSDDLIVQKDFIARHLESLHCNPGSWIVGGFKQLETLVQTPFGRYLEHLENSYDEERRGKQIGPELWEMTWPSARNMSLPRSDFDTIGLFDERFRTGSEDQDLALRARKAGIRFIYDLSIQTLHNDQSADLCRHCRSQRGFARDAALLSAKHPECEKNETMARENGPVSMSDDLLLILRKLIKRVLSMDFSLRLLVKLVWVAEWAGLGDTFLWPMYRFVAGLHVYRGWREGLQVINSSE